MPFPERHRLLTIGGTSWAAQEQWAFSLRLSGVAAPTQANVDSIAAATTTFWNDASMAINSVSVLTFAKLAPIGTDGKYPPGEDAVEHTFTADPGPGTSTGRWPPQCALAVTLTTALPRGLASKGRFYLPPCDFPIGTDGRFISSSAAAVVAATRTWINAINGSTAGIVRVYSRGIGGGTGPGTFQTVTGVRVGNVVDTQRRRRRQITESYSVGTIP